MVRRVYRVYRIYWVYRVYRVYMVYRVYTVCRVCRVYRSLGFRAPTAGTGTAGPDDLDNSPPHPHHTSPLAFRVQGLGFRAYHKEGWEARLAGFLDQVLKHVCSGH